MANELIFPDDSPYAALNTLTISERCNGYLNADRMLNNWRRACAENNFLTQEMYDKLTDAEKAELHGKIAGWKTVGGLKMPMNGAGDNYYEELRKYEFRLAAQQARADRIAAGWKDESELKGTNTYNPGKLNEDKTYLVAPDGSTTVATGQPYGDYTGPLDYVEKTGIFGGRFTI